MSEDRAGRPGGQERPESADALRDLRFHRAAVEAALDEVGRQGSWDGRKAWSLTAQAYATLYAGDQLGRIAAALEDR